MAHDGMKRIENRILFPYRVGWSASIGFRKMLHGLVEKRGYEEIVLDFSRVVKAYPNGMVPVISEMTHYKERRKIDFSVVFPHKESVFSLFTRNGWLFYLDTDGYPEPQSTSTASNLPLQKFSSDVELNDIVNKAVDLCIQQLVFADGVPQAFEWVLNEIAGNVLVHSEAGYGWMQVVTYRENHRLAMIVCDSGIGIPRSMAAKYEFKNDVAAIELAMRKGVTSKPQYGQGNGLAGALAIAQNSMGSFALTSSRGRVRVVEGKVEAKPHFPPYSGTCVDIQFYTDKPIDLPKALWGHRPVDYMELAFEDDKGDLVFRLRDYATSFGNRITGERIRNLLVNLLKQKPGHVVRIDMSEVTVISSSFADELFGKLYVEMGPIDFARLIHFDMLNPTCKSIIDLAISQRIAQTITNVTKVE